MKVVLCICPPWGLRSPPVSLGCLAEQLHQHGVEVDVYDLNLELAHRLGEQWAWLWDIAHHAAWRDLDDPPWSHPPVAAAVERCLDELAGRSPDLVGWCVVDPNEQLTCHSVVQFRRRLPAVPQVLGGPATATKGTRQILLDRSRADCFVVGEGEQALLGVVRALEIGGDPSEVSGVAWGGTEPFGGPAPIVASLDELPFPTYRAFDLSRYHGPGMAVMWSRGCAGRCSYCKERALWPRYRSVGAERRLAELRYHVERHGCREFVLYDSAVNADRRCLESTCQRLCELGLGIRWSGEAIPRRLDPSLLALMKRAGCHTLVFGVESGSEAVLARMRKPFALAEAERVLRATHHAGIRCWINIIVGYPGETRADFVATLQLLERNRVYIDRIDSLSSLQVVEGTELCGQATKLGLVLPPLRGHDRWYDPTGNTAALRQARLAEATRHAQALGIPIGRNFLDEAQGEDARS